MSITGSSRRLLAQLEVGQGSAEFQGKFAVGQGSAELLGKAIIRHVGTPAELLCNGIIKNVDSAELLGRFEAQATTELLGKFAVGQSSAEFLGRVEVGQGSTELLGKFEAQATAELLSKFAVGQGSTELLGKFAVGQGSTELLGKFETQAIAELLGKLVVKNIGTAELLGKFAVGQSSAEFLGRVEVGQGSTELLGKFEAQATAELLSRFEAQVTAELLGRFAVGQGSAELLGKFEAQATAELLGRFEAQATAELLGKFAVGQGFTELLGKTVIRHPGSAELLGKTIIRNVDSAELLGKFEAQATAELLGKFEAQAIAELLCKFAVGQGSTELLGKFAVGQGSAELLGKFEAQAIADLLGRFEAQATAELLGKGIIKNEATIELLGKFEAQATAELLSRTIIGHPAFPAWLKAIFSIGLTNAHRDLRSIIRLRHDGTPVELFGKAEVRQSTSAELLGKGVVRNIGSAELLGKAIIRGAASAELLCGFAAQSFADLRAKMIIGPAKTSDAYFSFWDPSDWINEVVGIGQGFIAIPWVEADADVKTSGNSSARLTSNYSPHKYKEIRFGWGGMNWGVEVAVPPEVAPTPIDTDGRGPRRGSRASRDWRREVPQSSYKELKSIFTVNELAGVVAQLRDITDADGWWQHAYDGGSAFLLVPNADGTLTVRSHFAAGVPAVGGGAYGTNKSFLPTAGNPITIEWEIQCNAPVGPGGSTFSIHFLGGLTDGRDTSSGSNEISLYYDGDNDQHVLEIYEEGVNSFNADWTAVSITDKIKFKIVWEHPDDVAPNGRIRVYIDDVLTFTETTVVPETELCFFFGVMLYRQSGTPTAEATLHSISEL